MNSKASFVDLSNYFNYSLDDEIHNKPGNDLSAVPHGINDFAGTLFNAQGIIQLSGSISKEKTGSEFPSEVKGILVNSKGKKINFLHCASWHDMPNTKIGEYRINYSNEHIEIIPIVNQLDVADWWFMPSDKVPELAKVAWKGQNDRTKDLDYSIQLYKSIWNNPFPEIQIKSIDFISDGKEAAPFLMAITVE